MYKLQTAVCDRRMLAAAGQGKNTFERSDNEDELALKQKTDPSGYRHDFPLRDSVRCRGTGAEAGRKEGFGGSQGSGEKGSGRVC
jgi:hypothetical protein